WRAGDMPRIYSRADWSANKSGSACADANVNASDSVNLQLRDLGAPEQLADPLASLAARVAKDVGAAFKDDVLDALVALHARDLPAYESLVAQLDKANKSLHSKELRRAVKQRAALKRKAEAQAKSEADGKPRLLIDLTNFDKVVDATADLLATESVLFERGVVV